MIDPLSIVISSLALAVSATTLWFNVLRRGRLAMTKPTLVFFGCDLVPHRWPKITIRTLLYSTAARPKVVEAMYLKLRGDDADEAVFSFWGYGETTTLVKGSGLQVGQVGQSHYHHFNTSSHYADYTFRAGDHTIEVFAILGNDPAPTKLSAIQVRLTDEHAAALARGQGVEFDLEPVEQKYVGRIR